MFIDLLETNLLLKNIFKRQEWDPIKSHVKIRYRSDSHYAESKEIELLRKRIDTANSATPYIGKYFSHDTIRRKILKQTDDDITNEDKIIKKELSDTKYISDNENANGIFPMSNGKISSVTLDLDTEDDKNSPPRHSTEDSKE